MANFYPKYYTLSFFWFGIIVVMSTWTGSGIPQGQSKYLPEDKVVHFFLFLIFGMLLLTALKKNHFKSGLRHSTPIAIGFLLFSAFLSEGLQFLANGRQFEWLDLGVDIFGMVVALLLFRLIFGKHLFLS